MKRDGERLMKSKTKQKLIIAALLCAVIPILAGCGMGMGTSALSANKQTASAGQFKAVFYENTFHPTDDIEGVSFDSSTLGKGYIGISAKNDSRLKAQISIDDKQYTYNIPNNGSVCYLPFQFGSGEYRLRLLQNTVDTKYLLLFEQSLNVQLEDEFQPFLRSNVFCNYSSDSLVVKKAEEFAAQSSGEDDYVRRVYNFITNEVKYDYEFARSVGVGYVPNPNITVQSKKGICFDISSLAAAMLRSQGIPAKIITGYVGAGADPLYHAWNAIYLKEQGWVTVKIKASPNSWARIDLTFLVTGESDESLYVDRYVY